jgi:hypothetical protein
MLRVEPGQIWRVRVGGDGTWRRVYVVNVAGDSVALEYLNVSKVFDVRKTFAASQSAMLLTAADYQFVTKGPRKSRGRRPAPRTNTASELRVIIESR